MKKYRELEAKLDSAVENCQNIIYSISKNAQEFIDINKKRIDVYNNLDIVVDDIEKQFAQKTSILNFKDQTFLWTAIALQTLRWTLLPEFKIDDIKPVFDDREKAAKGGNREKKDQENYLSERSNKKSKDGHKHLDWEEYYKRPVPYDAMIGEGAQNIAINDVINYGKNLTGKNHHAATLGHDPVLGYLFGTMNIMTSTITFHKVFFPTNFVYYETHTVGESKGFIPTVIEMVNAEVEDTFRVPAALARQAMHMVSDKMTKMGLPIPLLSAEAQQKLLRKGWNSKELERITESLKNHWKENLGIVALQFALALIINLIIQTLHILMFNEEKDVYMDLYKIRTHKILATSSVIAESINIAYVGGTVAVGLKTGNADTIRHGLGKIDIGGYIEALHQIVSSATLQKKLRREFLEYKLYEKLDAGHEYSFLQER
ncbi:MAG: hypothetical protein M0P01_13440 [Treponema sp.]|nr:hypothetical protein [Treponema sp.]